MRGKTKDEREWVQQIIAQSDETSTDTSMWSKAFAGPSHEPESGQAFSCSRATATENARCGDLAVGGIEFLRAGARNVDRSQK